MLGTRLGEAAVVEVTRPPTTLPPGAALGLTGIVGGGKIEGQPPRAMHIALTEGERVEYETYAYY